MGDEQNLWKLKEILRKEFPFTQLIVQTGNIEFIVRKIQETIQEVANGHTSGVLDFL